MGEAEDTFFMKRALRLAAKAAGRTSPNPMVGAVVVRGGEVVGEGYHKAAGEPHAEVVALRAARDRARGATLYTTLEPCAHVGRTPPCVDAMREAGVVRVVVAMRDPDPRTDGKGFRLLRAANVEVTQGVLEGDAKRLNEGFISRVRRGRPFVLVKLATTVDGRVAVKGRRYLSGKTALREVHRLRDRYDAILVGIGTVLADDPALTVREVRGRDPLRVIVDTEARTPINAKVLHAKDPQRIDLRWERIIGIQHCLKSEKFPFRAPHVMLARLRRRLALIHRQFSCAFVNLSPLLTACPRSASQAAMETRLLFAG